MSASPFVRRMVARGAGLTAAVRPPKPAVPEPTGATRELAVEDIESIAQPPRAATEPAAERAPAPEPSSGPAPTPFVAAPRAPEPIAPAPAVTPARAAAEVRRSP